MATVTTQKIGAGRPALGQLSRIAEIEIDFSTFLPDQNDIVQLIQTFEDDVVLAMQWEIVTQATAATSLKIGKDGGTELSTAINAAQAAGTKGVGTHTTPVSFDNDTIDMDVEGATPLVGKLRFRFLIQTMIALPRP